MPRSCATATLLSPATLDVVLCAAWSSCEYCFSRFFIRASNTTSPLTKAPSPTALASPSTHAIAPRRPHSPGPPPPPPPGRPARHRPHQAVLKREDRQLLQHALHRLTLQHIHIFKLQDLQFTCRNRCAAVQQVVTSVTFAHRLDLYRSSHRDARRTLLDIHAWAYARSPLDSPATHPPRGRIASCVLYSSHATPGRPGVKSTIFDGSAEHPVQPAVAER